MNNNKLKRISLYLMAFGHIGFLWAGALYGTFFMGAIAIVLLAFEMKEVSK